jgi:hypothetical protein
MGLLTVNALFIGTAAAFAPRTFYDNFPYLTQWVELLPPYNEHLITDTGGLYLGLAVIFSWATWKPERTLVLAASTAFTVVATLHLAYHLTHLDGFGTADALFEAVSLASLLLPPLGAIVAVRPPT